MNNIKDRISDYVSFLEMAGKELEKQQAVMQDSLAKIAKEKDKDKQKELAAEYFANFQYVNILQRDIGGKIYGISELYFVSQAGKEKVSFTEEEHKMLEGYAAQAQFLFVLDKGEITTVQKDLLNMMINRSKAIIDSSVVEDIIRQANRQFNNKQDEEKQGTGKAKK